ncbi:MAG: hypothetical protein ACR65X_09610 [Methylocystis sp.]
MADSTHTPNPSPIPQSPSAGEAIDNAVFESAYAFRMPNGSAAPMIHAGQKVTVDPARRLEPKCGVVLFRADRSEFIVRELVRSDRTHWHVQRYGSDEPADWKAQKLLRDEWPIAEFIYSVSSPNSAGG